MKSLNCFLATAVIFMASCGTEEAARNTNEPAGEPAPAMTAGQKLFINNCIQCHNITKDKIGPKLEGVLARWDNDTARMRAFVRNSTAVIDAGDPHAVELYNKWNKTLMTPMPHLTDGDIDDILEYIYTAKE